MKHDFLEIKLASVWLPTLVTDVPPSTSDGPVWFSRVLAGIDGGAHSAIEQSEVS